MPRPFLKWPGGKYRLIDRITKSLGKGNRLIEPFVGSGAVFLNTDFDQYLLADTNLDLINLYKILQKNGEDFIDYSRLFFQPENNVEEIYYQFRSEFNSTEDIQQKSALFIYLNRHCYNGLCRYNKSGKFNSPFGRYKKPSLPESAMQTFIEKSPRAKFMNSDFHDTFKQAKKGDVIYCDPPYMPLSKTASFTNYSANNFGWEQQQELAEIAIKTSEKGIPVIISNHNTPEIRKLYQQAKISRFDVQRFISQNADNRNKVSELIAVFETC